MSTIRVKKEQKYFVAANAPFQDKSLTWEARGIMGYLLSKPDGWQCRNYDLVNQGPAGEHTIKRVLKELKAAGYIHRFKISKGRGKIEWITEIYETPDLNPNFTTGDFTTVVNTTGDTIEVEKSTDIVSTDSQKVLISKSTDILQNSQKSKNQYTPTQRDALNRLGKVIAHSGNIGYIQTADELRAITLIGADIAEITKTDILTIDLGELRALAGLTIRLNDKPDIDTKLKTFKEWWYNEHWLGKDKGQSPTVKQLGSTWGQFEAQEIQKTTNAPITVKDGFYV